MTTGAAIIIILHDNGPLTRDDLCEEVHARFGLAPVIVATVLVGMQYKGEVVLRDDLYSLPPADEGETP